MSKWVKKVGKKVPSFKFEIQILNRRIVYGM